jgi:hypothetical protein
MQHKLVRLIICGLEALVALTAIGGGIAMLVGLDSFPPEWLAGTPFTDYTIPALILAAVVGGSALVTAVAILRRHEAGVLAAMAAGLVLAGYIFVEVVLLKQVPPGPTVMEQIYFVTGLAVFWLATYLWMAEYRQTEKKN